MTTTEATRVVHADLEGLATRLKTALLDAGDGLPSPTLPKGELQELVTEAAVALIEYKGLAREGAMAVENCRAEMQAKKREVDERHLQLQNLLYEKDHLQRTIQTLRDFPLKELAKMEREEGAQLLPGLVHGGEGRLLSVEEHRNNMERLRAEKETRDRLHQEHVAAQKQRETLVNELNQLRETLGSTLPRQIEELEALCTGIQGRMPDLPVAAPFGGYPVEDVRALPQALYTLLGRLHAYVQAFGPDQTKVRVSILACVDAKLPATVVVAGTEAARQAVAAAAAAPATAAPSSSAMDLDGDDEGEGDFPPVVVDAHAIQLEFENGGLDEEEVTDVVVFYYATEKQEVLVSVPGRHPHALVNLLPGDTGAAWARIAADAASTAGLADEGGAASRRGRRRPATKKGVGESNGVPPPQSFMWLQWMGGSSPFPAQYMDLGPAYTTTCILNRLRVRLRAQRTLDAFLEGLHKRPKALPMDTSSPVAAQLFPSLGGGKAGWEVAEFKEIALAFLDTDPFQEAVGGIRGGGGAAAAAEGDEGAGGPEDEQHMAVDGSVLAASQQLSGTKGGVGDEASAAAAWERAGARYFEVSLRKEAESKKEKAQGLSMVVELTAEYPIRPPRFRLCPATATTNERTFDNAFADVLLEVNAYYEELLLVGGARDWLLPHQLHKLLFALTAMDLGNPSAGASFGNAAARLRWGKDRRRSYNYDVHAALLIPR